MVRTTLFGICTLFVFCCQFGFAQDAACQLILQQGLYKYYTVTNTGNFSQDIKTYLLSDTFKSDVKSHKWGGGLSAVIDAVPIKLNADASDSEISQFQQRIRQSSSFTLDQSFYAYASTAVPDVELAKVYSDCIANSTQTGFRIFPSVGDDSVLFVVKYGKVSSSDPMPKVRLFEARNNVVINCTKSFTTSEPQSTLGDTTSINCPRNPNFDLTITLETDHGVVAYRVPSAPSGFNKDIPVGTVISSALNWDTFQAVTKNNDANPGGSFWTARYSKWAPADGRNVPGSAFERAVSMTTVPDLRGIFIRGLNVFDLSETTHNARDPENRTVGSYQTDGFTKHNHGGGTHNHTTGTQNGAVPANPGLIVRVPAGTIGDRYPSKTSDAEKVIEDNGGSETRPKNVAVFYYIRIN
jgi:hypothetical protein